MNTLKKQNKVDKAMCPKCSSDEVKIGTATRQGYKLLKNSSIRKYLEKVYKCKECRNIFHILPVVLK